jgi:hypothetical protein
LKTARGTKLKSSKQHQKRSFDQILLDAIDEALSSLGENVKTAVYSNLENLYQIRKQDIPSRLSDFSGAVEQFFGLGARYLEIMCMKNLHAKINVTCKWPEYEWPLCKWIVPEITFQEYVRLMRQNFKAANANKTQIGMINYEQEELQKRRRSSSSSKFTI